MQCLTQCLHPSQIVESWSSVMTLIQAQSRVLAPRELNQNMFDKLTGDPRCNETHDPEKQQEHKLSLMEPNGSSSTFVSDGACSVICAEVQPSCPAREA